jgi:putative transposase
MKNTRKKYSADFKIWAVKTSMDYKSVRHAADKLQINKNSLQHWKNLFREGKLSQQKTAGWDSDKKEIAGLRKKIKDIKLERDILKKAPSTFTRRDGPDMNLSGKTLINFPS